MFMLFWVVVEYFRNGTTLNQVEDPIFGTRDVNIK
jgi:hypothetical protein